MAQLQPIISFTNKFNDNLLSNKSATLQGVTITHSGTGAISVTALNSYAENASSIELFAVQDVIDGVSETFDLGDALEYIALDDGNHIFQFSIFNNDLNANPDYHVDLNLNLYVNSVLIETYTTDVNLSGLANKHFYTFAQSFTLDAGDVVNFSFNITSPSVGTPNPNFKLNFSGFKIELDNKNIAIPTPYSLPKNYFLTESNDFLKNIYHGWGYYADSLATPTITIGTSYTQLTIDALGALTNENFLPLEIRGTDSLWSGNKITPVAVGDDYDGRLDVTVTAKSGSPTFIEIILDISGSTAGSNKVFTGYIQTGGTVPYDQSLPLDFFSLTTFLANGGRLYARVDTGSVTVGRRNIKISRKSKAF